jgi:hypothetical protein
MCENIRCSIAAPRCANLLWIDLEPMHVLLIHMLAATPEQRHPPPVPIAEMPQAQFVNVHDQVCVTVRMGVIAER